MRNMAMSTHGRGKSTSMDMETFEQEETMESINVFNSVILREIDDDD